MARIILLAAILSSIGLALLPAVPVQAACSCGYSTRADWYSRSTVVFTGTLARLEYFAETPTPGRQPYHLQWATFSVTESWKGVSSPEITVRMHRHDEPNEADSGQCGFDLVRDKSYLVLASSTRDGGLITSACAGTSELVGYARSQFGLMNGTPVTPGFGANTTPAMMFVPAPLATARAQGVSERAPPTSIQAPHRSPSPGQSSLLPIWLSELSGIGILGLGMVAAFAMGIVVLAVPRRQ